jgi:hypothetical protein
MCAPGVTEGCSLIRLSREKKAVASVGQGCVQRREGRRWQPGSERARWSEEGWQNGRSFEPHLPVVKAGGDRLGKTACQVGFRRRGEGCHAV